MKNASHRFISNEEAVLLSVEMKEKKVIQLEGVEIWLGQIVNETVSVLIFPALGDHALIEIPFAGKNAFL